MGYMMVADGQVQFQCRGCSKTVVRRSLIALPHGWYISGILGALADPESLPVNPYTDPQALQEAASSVADYFCGKTCAKKFLLTPEVKQKIKRLGIRLVLWGKCELVIDGTPITDDDRELNAAAFGGGGEDDGPDQQPERRHPEDAPEPPKHGKGGGKRHIGEDGKEKPGSPPPMRFDGGSPI